MSKLQCNCLQYLDQWQYCFCPVFVSLSFNTNTSDQSWGQLLVWCGWFVSRNWGKKLTWNFWLDNFAQEVSSAKHYTQTNACFSNLFRSDFDSKPLQLLHNLPPSSAPCSAPSSVFGTSSCKCSSKTTVLSCFLVHGRIQVAFALPVDFFPFLLLAVIVGRIRAAFPFNICYDIFSSMTRCNFSFSGGLNIWLHRLLDTVFGYYSINLTCDRQPYIFAAHYKRKIIDFKKIYLI